MFKSAWDGIQVISELMKERVERQKHVGMTMVIDTCMGPQMLQDMLLVSNKYIDHWKCSYGVSAVMPADILRQMLDTLNQYNINTFPGGTLLEAAIVQKNCQSYMLRAREIGFRSVEISDGTITLPIKRRRNAILCALDNGLIPITEVGKKDPAKQPGPEELADLILQDLYFGAEYVVVDARESGRCNRYIRSGWRPEARNISKNLVAGWAKDGKSHLGSPPEKTAGRPDRTNRPKCKPRECKPHGRPVTGVIAPGTSV